MKGEAVTNNYVSYKLSQIYISYLIDFFSLQETYGLMSPPAATELTFYHGQVEINTTCGGRTTAGVKCCGVYII